MALRLSDGSAGASAGKKLQHWIFEAELPFFGPRVPTAVELKLLLRRPTTHVALSAASGFPPRLGGSHAHAVPSMKLCSV